MLRRSQPREIRNAADRILAYAQFLEEKVKPIIDDCLESCPSKPLDGDLKDACGDVHEAAVKLIEAIGGYARC